MISINNNGRKNGMIRPKWKTKFVSRSRSKNLNAKSSFLFLFFFVAFVQALKWNVNVICQYFKCKAHDIHCSYELELNVIQTRKQISGNSFNFSRQFCHISPKSRQFDFDFWKSPDKNDKCSNLWQKIKCMRYRKQTCFLFWPNDKSCNEMVKIEEGRCNHKITISNQQSHPCLHTLFCNSNLHCRLIFNSWTASNMHPFSEHLYSYCIHQLILPLNKQDQTQLAASSPFFKSPCVGLLLITRSKHCKARSLSRVWQWCCHGNIISSPSKYFSSNMFFWYKFVKGSDCVVERRRKVIEYERITNEDEYQLLVKCQMV